MKKLSFLDDFKLLLKRDKTYENSIYNTHINFLLVKKLIILPV